MSERGRRIADADMRLVERKKRAERRQTMVNDYISKAKFEKFFSEYKKNKLDGYGSWADAVPPYKKLK
jgi:hypothetical protein